MDSAKNQLADKLKTSNNVLVTVSRDPSVDQLSALLGLTLALNKTGKHAAAVFSGQVPSTLEFLKPENTIEKNTDSLRDFIIALDKSKADKLRYKVEDDVVRIFITPYKTSISDADLEFSQGDFNVDIVIAIGVQQQEDLDEAITAHGRILHDATVTSINVLNAQSEGLGSINWHDDQTSSLSEMVTELLQVVDPTLVDEQIATALLTGIVAETERFSNEKTTAQTMSMSALLMAAGANQQLVATKLEEPAPESEPAAEPEAADEDEQTAAEDENEPPKSNDGTIEIDHQHDAPPAKNEAGPEPAIDLPAPEEVAEPEPENQPEQSESAPNEPEVTETDGLSSGSRMITEPPTMGGQLTANSHPEALDPSTDPMSAVQAGDDQLLTRDSAAASTDPLPAVVPEPVPSPAPEEVAEPEPANHPEQPEQVPSPEPVIEAALAAPILTPPPAEWSPQSPEPAPQFDPVSQPAPQSQPELQPSVETLPTLSDLEAVVTQNEAQHAPADVNDARDEVSRALSSDAAVLPPSPIAALNAQPLGETLHPLEVPQPPEVQPPAAQTNDYTSVEDLLKQSSTDPLLATVTPPAVPIPDDVVTQQAPAVNSAAQTPQVTDPNPPPPVPPPIPFQFGQPPAGSNSQNPQQ